MTRILFVEHNTDGTVGGSHYALLDICRGVDRTRFEPVVIFFEEHSLLDRFRQLDIQVIVGSPAPGMVTLPRPRTGVLNPILRLAQAAANAIRLLTVRTWRWRRLLRRLKPDLVHLNNSFNGDHDLVLAAASLRIPCIAHQRGIPGTTGRLELFFARFIVAIVAISTMIRRDLLERGIPTSRIHLIHDGIDPSRVVVRRAAEDVRRELGLAASDRLIGMVGNVKPWKGQHVVIEALGHMVATRDDVHLVLVGSLPDPGYEAALRDRIRALGLESRIHFTGFQQNPADLVAAMDVVVHASVEPEPFGLVLLEAMALQKPVVSTTIGGPADIVVDGDNGFLCPPGDDRTLAGRLLALLEDPAAATRMGARGRERLMSRFTATHNVRALERLWDQVRHR